MDYFQILVFFQLETNLKSHLFFLNCAELAFFSIFTLFADLTLAKQNYFSYFSNHQLQSIQALTLMHWGIV